MKRYLTPRHLSAYTITLIIIGAIILFALFGLKPTAQILTRTTGHHLKIRSITWISWHSLKINGIEFDNNIRIQQIDARWSWPQLTLLNLDRLRIHGAQWRISATARTPGPTGTTWIPPITIGKLIISQSSIALQDLGHDLPPATLQLAETPPALVFENVKLGSRFWLDPAAHQIQTVTIPNFTIYSPYDPIAKIFEVQQIIVRFTWEDLLEHQLEELTLQKPTLYVGPDLFWLTDQVRNTTPTNTPTPPQPWTIHRFTLTAGQLALSFQGEAVLNIPGSIEVEPTQLIIGDFARFHLKTKFHTEVPQLNYPEYQLKIKHLVADLQFNLPPSPDRKLDNVVRTFKADQVEWKGLKFGTQKSPVWISFTVDPQGIFGHFGAPAYSGYLDGGLLIRFENGLPWLAWGNSKQVQLKPITDLLCGDNATIDGPVQLAFKARGQAQEIQGLGGTITFNQPGILNITAMDKLQIPADWPALKRELTRIPLDAFHRYDFTKGQCDFAYAPPESFIKLDLHGLQGHRTFDIRWHDQRQHPDPILVHYNDQQN